MYTSKIRETSIEYVCTKIMPTKRVRVDARNRVMIVYKWLDKGSKKQEALNYATQVCV